MCSFYKRNKRGDGDERDTDDGGGALGDAGVEDPNSISLYLVLPWWKLILDELILIKNELSMTQFMFWHIQVKVSSTINLRLNLLSRNSKSWLQVKINFGVRIAFSMEAKYSNMYQNQFYTFKITFSSGFCKGLKDFICCQRGLKDFIFHLMQETSFAEYDKHLCQSSQTI